MSKLAAFISAILDNPADDTVRLVFADWLDGRRACRVRPRCR